MSVLSVAAAYATPFTAIRIGDVDGFGLGVGTGLTAANGGPANVDGVGMLGNGDFLPDWNGDGGTLTGSDDDFDYRLGETLTGSGYTDAGSSGTEFTDISLSTSYDASAAGGRVHIPPAYTGLGSGGTFPKSPSTTLPNQPGFVFDFFVATGDILSGAPMFFNMVFGDYDVSPADVVITRADASTVTLPISVQPPGSDGLIQSAFVTLSFADVFTAVGGGYDGYLEADFVAPEEPYTAFDFVELSTRPIDVPDPACTSVLLGLAVIAVGGMRRRLGL
jgi:hypothetical protein